MKNDHDTLEKDGFKKMKFTNSIVWFEKNKKSLLGIWFHLQKICKITVPQIFNLEEPNQKLATYIRLFA